MDPEVYEGRDRLSELPNSLILSILSLLETRDAVTTTFLSKRWQNLWTTVPCLHFCNQKPDFIHAALAQWKGPKVTKFTMKFFSFDDDMCPSTDIDSWLYFAIATQPEELHMNLSNRRSYTRSEYSPPQLLYSCSSLTILTLSYCNLKIAGNVQWSRLKSLTFFSEKSLSEEPLNKILSGAPLLEELDLCVYEISENFSIRSRSLKKLKMGRPSWDSAQHIVKAVLRIWAPNLLILDISDFFHGCCCFDVPSLIHAEYNDFMVQVTNSGVSSARYEMFYRLFRSISHVEKISLSDSFIKLLVEMKKKGMDVQFSKAEFLNLTNAVGNKMVYVLGMFPKLVAMSILNNESRDASSSSLPSEMAFPIHSLLHLKRVEIVIWHTLDSIFLDIEILLANAPMLEKMVFRLRNYDAHNPNKSILVQEIREKMISMPSASPTAKLIIIGESRKGKL